MAVNLLEGYEKTSNPKKINLLEGFEDKKKSFDLLEGYEEPKQEVKQGATPILKGGVTYYPEEYLNSPEYQEQISKNIEIAKKQGLDEGKTVDLTPQMYEQAIMGAVPVLNGTKFALPAKLAIQGGTAGLLQSSMQKLRGENPDILGNITGGAIANTALGIPAHFLMTGLPYLKNVGKPIFDYLEDNTIPALKWLGNETLEYLSFMPNKPHNLSRTKKLVNEVENAQNIIDYKKLKDAATENTKFVPDESLYTKPPKPEMDFKDKWDSPYGEYLPELENMPLDEAGNPSRNIVNIKGLSGDDIGNIHNWMALNPDITDIPLNIIKNNYDYGIDYDTGKQIFLNSLTHKDLKRFDKNVNPIKLYDYLYQSIKGRAANYGRIPKHYDTEGINNFAEIPMFHPDFNIRENGVLKYLEAQKQDTGSPLDYTKNEAIEWINSLPEKVKQNSSFVKLIKEKYRLEE